MTPLLDQAPACPGRRLGGSNSSVLQRLWGDRRGPEPFRGFPDPASDALWLEVSSLRQPGLAE